MYCSNIKNLKVNLEGRGGVMLCTKVSCVVGTWQEKERGMEVIMGNENVALMVRG